MVGCNVLEKHTIVVMDASDYRVIDSIIAWIYNIERENTRARTYSLDGRTSMRFIDVLTLSDAYKTLQFVLDDLYPGLCVFDPPM